MLQPIHTSVRPWQPTQSCLSGLPVSTQGLIKTAGTAMNVANSTALSKNWEDSQNMFQVMSPSTGFFPPLPSAFVHSFFITSQAPSEPALFQPFL